MTTARFQEKAEDVNLVIVDHSNGRFSILKDKETNDLPEYPVDIIKIMQRLRAFNGTTVLWVSMSGS